jgi:hypothetical protein
LFLADLLRVAGIVELAGNILEMHLFFMFFNLRNVVLL